MKGSTTRLDEALKKHSKKPKLAGTDSNNVSYMAPRINDLMDEDQIEHDQRANGLNYSLIVGEQREDFKY